MNESVCPRRVITTTERMKLESCLSLADLCRELGLQQQYVLELASEAEKFYTTFDRPKRSGGTRPICASEGRLKSFQRTLLSGVLSRYPMPQHVHGCVKGRSTATNAREHVNQDVVLNIDLSDFFGSIHFDSIRQIYQDIFSFDDGASRTLSQLTTFKNRLPQGAPTSPALANLAALELDLAIIQVCTQALSDENFSYSRYVDDITISGSNSIVELLPQVHQAIERNGFRAHPQKTRILRKSTRQWVTGMVVNQKLSPPKTVIRKVRQHLYYCQRYGIKDHCETHGTNPAAFLAKLRGCIGYIRMTRPELADEFTELLKAVNPESVEGDSIEEHNLKFLKEAITEECFVRFIYKQTQCQVAPAELLLDDDGNIQLRAFQLQPEPGWRYFVLTDISALEFPSKPLL